MPGAINSTAKDDEVEKPKWRGGTGHVYFDVETSGYEREGMRASQRTKIAFMRNMYLLERAPNACLGEIYEDVKGKYLVRMPEGKTETVLHNAEHSIRESLLNATSNTTDKCNTIESEIRVDQLKHRRDVIAKQLRELEYDMSAGRAGYESNSRERGLVELRKDEKGRQFGLAKSLRPFVTTTNVGKTSMEDFNYFNGTGIAAPDLPNRGMKSTLMKYPNLRTKSKLPRIPGVGFA